MTIPDWQRQGASDAPERPPGMAPAAPAGEADGVLKQVLLFTVVVLVGALALTLLQLALDVSSRPLSWLGAAAIGLLASSVLEPRHERQRARSDDEGAQ